MQLVDLEKFWVDDEVAHRNNCFCENAQQVALGIRMSEECVFAELGEEGDFWGTIPRERRIDLNKRYNDKAEKIVGMRLLNEEIPLEDEKFPCIKRIGEVFEGTYGAGYMTGEWLHGNVTTPAELEKLLDRLNKLNLREFMLPSNWESEKKRIYEKYGKKPGILRSVRGPVTLAMSIYGEENLIYLNYDAPELYERFSQTIARVILDMGKIMDIEAGYQEGKAPEGFWFADDNCALLSPEMYESFGYPVLKQVFEYFSPSKDSHRFQHSDSAMDICCPYSANLISLVVILDRQYWWMKLENTCHRRE